MRAEFMPSEPPEPGQYNPFGLTTNGHARVGAALADGRSASESSASRRSIYISSGYRSAPKGSK